MKETTVNTRPTKEEYITSVKYEMCRIEGLQDGTSCERSGCLEEEVCSGCGRHRGVLVKPEGYKERQ